MTRPLLPAVLGAAGALGALVFLVAAALLQVLRPDINALSGYASGFANGPYGPAFSAGAVIHGLGNIALAMGLALILGAGRAAVWGSLLLGLAGWGIVLAGLFPTDPAGAAPTLTGIIHLTVAAASFPIEFAGLLLLARAFGASESWRAFAGPTRWLAWLGGASLLWLLAAVALRSWAGLAERAALLTFMAWELWASLRLALASTPRTDGKSGMAVFALALMPLAFGLNFAWEYAQCRAFFVHGELPVTAAAMRIATLGDLALTGLAYLGVAALARSWRWPLEAWTARVWTGLLGLALVASIGIELNALATGRWSYTAAAPRLPFTPVSLLPVVQLLVLFPLSFGLARLTAFTLIHTTQNTETAP